MRAPVLIHGCSRVVDFWGLVLGGVVPLPVQIGARGVGAQVAPPCAVRVHVRHLHMSRDHRILASTYACCRGEQHAHNAQRYLRHISQN